MNIIKYITSIFSNQEVVEDWGTDRKPMFCIFFDDGLPTDENVVSVLDTYGYKCCFAIVSSQKQTFKKYRKLQKQGYEICSHSTDFNLIGVKSGDLSLDDAEKAFSESKRILGRNGFNIQGWVTPQSAMHENYIPLLRKYYNWAFTEYLGTATRDNMYKVYHQVDDDLMHLRRVSLESSSEIDILEAIDTTVSNNGICFMYAHKYPDDGKLTESRFNNILNRIKYYVDQNKAIITTPTKAIQHYYYDSINS